MRLVEYTKEINSRIIAIVAEKSSPCSLLLRPKPDAKKLKISPKISPKKYSQDPGPEFSINWSNASNAPDFRNPINQLKTDGRIT
jgi:hypothetical protein